MSDGIEFGFSVPTRGPMATHEGLIALAQRGEGLGFGIVAVSDHVIIPRHIASIYPYSVSGEFSGDPSGACLEQLTLLSFLAGATSRIRLLTSVMVVPHRPAVLTAKVLASIDVLSNGRLIVGVGAGWMREEFEALGTPPYDERGAVTDEYINAFKELWSSDAPEFGGAYVQFHDVSFRPKPVQQPHPPIWVGGESPAALRRTARLGDAWYPIGNNPRHPVGSVEQLQQYVARLRRYAEEAGRDPETIDLAYSAGWYNERQAQTTDDGSRRIFTGSPEQIAGDIRAFRDNGVRHLMLGMQGSSLQESFERMERFATEVKPLVEG
jgi:probable F420-dependent oxidoreductase